MHEHVQVELKESGFYPEKLGLELVKSAQKTLGAASVQEGVCKFPLLSPMPQTPACVVSLSGSEGCDVVFLRAVGSNLAFW